MNYILKYFFYYKIINPDGPLVDIKSVFSVCFDILYDILIIHTYS